MHRHTYNNRREGLSESIRINVAGWLAEQVAWRISLQDTMSQVERKKRHWNIAGGILVRMGKSMKYIFCTIIHQGYINFALQTIYLPTY
jgi:hypothetical protein